jgi:protein-disulfide isomerase
MTAFVRRLALAAVFLAAALASAVVVAGSGAAAGALSGPQRQEVQELIRGYLMENPEVILESVRQYQAKQEAKAQAEAKAALVANRSQLESDADTPFAGNAKGDVTIVEFFDYNCGYCKQMIPTIQELLATDKNIRYVFKELPILRADSVTAAKAALAVWKIAPEKYFAYHVALMGGRGELSEDRLFRAAENLGIDTAKLKAAMVEPQIDQTIRRNRDISRLLGINGTPAFIVGDQLLPGAVDIATLREAIAKKRAG